MRSIYILEGYSFTLQCSLTPPSFSFPPILAPLLLLLKTIKITTKIRRPQNYHPKCHFFWPNKNWTPKLTHFPTSPKILDLQFLTIFPTSKIDPPFLPHFSWPTIIGNTIWPFSRPHKFLTLQTDPLSDTTKISYLRFLTIFTIFMTSLQKNSR